VQQDVDARDKPGHDEPNWKAPIPKAAFLNKNSRQLIYKIDCFDYYYLLDRLIEAFDIGCTKSTEPDYDQPSLPTRRQHQSRYFACP
jgi:hypothetical protein